MTSTAVKGVGSLFADMTATQAGKNAPGAGNFQDVWNDQLNKNAAENTFSDSAVQTAKKQNASNEEIQRGSSLKTKENQVVQEEPQEVQELSPEAMEEILTDKMLAENEERVEQIEEALSENDIADEVELSFTAQYVKLTMNGGLLFDSGSALLKDDAKLIIDKVGLILERYGNGGIIEIEGHTDNVPMHSAQYPSNEELSSARALSVFYYLTETTTLNPLNLKHAGMGERVPIADNSTPEGRSRNRRVEILIYNPSQS